MQFNSQKPVAVFCRQWNWTFASGSRVARTLKIFNDTRFADPIEAAWQLQVTAAGRRRGADFNVAAGQRRQFDIALTCPARSRGGRRANSSSPARAAARRFSATSSRWW